MIGNSHTIRSSLLRHMETLGILDITPNLIINAVGIYYMNKSLTIMLLFHWNGFVCLPMCFVSIEKKQVHKVRLLLRCLTAHSWIYNLIIGYPCWFKMSLFLWLCTSMLISHIWVHKSVWKRFTCFYYFAFLKKGQRELAAKKKYPYIGKMPLRQLSKIRIELF